MANTFKWALTPEKLAVLGILDDFYDLYCSLRMLYEAAITARINNTYRQKPFWPTEIDQQCIKDVRKLCEPLMNKYLYLFSESEFRIHATAYGFASFSMINTKKSSIPCRLDCSLVSFASFLNQLLCAISTIIHRYRSYHEPDIEYRQVCNEINTHIDVCVANQESNCYIPANTSIATTDDTLYVYSSLSSAKCYRQQHHVFPSRFIADLLNDSGRISLPVHYCRDCQRYFIGRITLSLFDKRFGKSVMRRYSQDSTSDFYESFCQESKLHQFGYNVVDGEMSSAERHALLIFLLQHKKITYHEICVTLERNIEMFQNRPNYQIAVKKWMEDSVFIGQHILSSS